MWGEIVASHSQTEVDAGGVGTLAGIVGNDASEGGADSGVFAHKVVGERGGNAVVDGEVVGDDADGA